MSQIFTNLPAPTANGSGAAVDVSAYGPLKTITVSGGADCVVVIEMSNDPAGTYWAPVWVFQNGGQKSFNIACRWLRATVQQYLVGTPVVNVGTRQNRRERGSNVLDAPYDAGAIYQAIQTQVKHGRYPVEHIYGEGTAGKQIAEILATVPLPPVQKTITY